MRTTGAAAHSTEQVRARIRLLATTDLHMQLVGHDYVNDRPAPRRGVVTLARLIAEARAEAQARGDLCLLLDNGDTLQGAPLGDWLAEHGGNLKPHPMAAILNQLGYDAVGLGNHDFDHGLDYLQSVLAQYAMPVVCTNLVSPSLPMLQRHAMLERPVTDTDGSAHVLRIAVLSVVPPQTAGWAQHHLGGRAKVFDVADVLPEALEEVRQEGADIVVVLAHMGFSEAHEDISRHGSVQEVAGLAGVDAVVAGHTHLRFPGPDHADLPGVDCYSGLLGCTPVVLPGVSGSDLGIIDLEIGRDSRAGVWKVLERSVRLQPQPERMRPDRQILRLAAPVHRATRAHLSQPVAEIDRPLHSYFCLAQCGGVSALIAAGKRRMVRRAVAGSALADLPILTSAAVPATGGLDGPSNFVFVARGAVPRRVIAGLVPYLNQIWAVRVSGAQVRDWLERSARIFRTLSPDAPDQLLTDPAVPGYCFDTIHGVHYEIDPTSPPAFDWSGRPIPRAEGRIRNLTFEGAPLDPGQEFLMATTHYRVGGGGGFEVHDETRVAFRSDTTSESAVLECLRAGSTAWEEPVSAWRFSPDLGVQAVLHTAPEAADFLDDIAEMSPEKLGLNAGGFLRLRLSL
ncbi:5'-nucleotidase C-terminal domain-containing protein [Sulfitobacter sp. LCG007]